MSKNGGRRSGVNECKMSNFNIENILKGTSHVTDVVNISEETRHGFQHKYSDDANILELDSSLGSPGESSCSTDAVQHTVKADLYGTDKDPAYDDEVQGYTHAVPEEAVGADSCPQQTSAGTGTQGEGTEENTGTILIQAQISEENVGASPKGQFNEGIVGASPQFTERIVETNSQAQYIEGNVGTNSQAPYIEGNVGTSQTGSADELSQLGDPHPGIPTTVYTDLSHPIVDHNHNELHTSAVHPYTAHREATYTDPEHPATATYPENGRAIYTDLDTTSHAYPEHRGATYTDQEHPATAHAYPAHKGPTYTDQDGNCYQEDGTPFECPPDYPGAQYAPRYQSLQSASCSVGPLADQTQTTQQEQATLYMSPGQQHHQQQQQYPQPNHLQHLHQRTFMSPEAQVRHLLSPGTRHNLSQGQSLVSLPIVCIQVPYITFPRVRV
ncbi:uncharacterized protein LOC127840887 isoform X3 [Dreissena polymorpha]|uniref:uncharacterized protein LOC127840887 isoform X3 n=1 Tax=Dreissena polymorpha TaxID=45954 RepID=UPI0022640436|nr:uncharacterized protein LOC127840887 isoform X3 [Dreissena polymorpha]